MTTTENTGIIAIDNLDTAGAITYWTLTGTTTIAKLRDAWLAAGLPEAWLPEEVTPAQALKRALADVFSGDRIDAVVNGEEWAVVRKVKGVDEKGHKISHAILLHARMQDGRPSEFSRVDHAHVTQAQLDAVRAAYHLRLEQLDHADVSGWLIKLVRRLDGVALRATGGMYFIPRAAVAQLRLAAGAVKSAGSHVVYEIPALKAESAADAVLAAIEAEAQAEVDAIEAFVAQGSAGKRALRTRAEDVADVRAKVERYETLLGRRLNPMRERVEKVRQTIARALITAEAGADGRAALADAIAETGRGMLELDERHASTPATDDESPARPLELD